VSVTAEGYTVTSAAAGPVKQADSNLSKPPAKAVTGPMWNYSGGVYTIKDGSEMLVMGKTTSNRIVVSGRVTLTLDNVVIL
jgi:hypothetical protein